MTDPSDTTADSKRSLRRHQAEIEPLSLLQWFAAQNNETKCYWADRQGDVEIAAVGCVESIDQANTQSFRQAIAIIQDRLRQSPSGLRYYGGRCFDFENVDSSQWHGFGPYRFIVPEYEIIRSGQTFILAVNNVEGSEVEIEQLKQKIVVDGQGKNSPAPKNRGLLSRQDVPPEPDWLQTAQQVVEMIGDEAVDKVVLAQRADLTTGSPVNPVELLNQIKTASTQTYSFLFQFPKSHTFLGASPECLFRKSGRDIFSEAIAGTRPVDSDCQVNEQLQDQLRQSAKESREHGFVADNIQAALQTICDDVSCTVSNQILQTASVQHLYSRYQGKLSEKTDISQIIDALHPTAAVNGLPSKKAADMIRTLEPFSRGWYAAPVGWIGADQAEFAVAIRSALVDAKGTISVYSGAGLVKDSDPEQEWVETELKKQLILNAVKSLIS
ncbi:MAG: isochorismate synthase [Planctomycetota bacterium]